MSGDFLQSSALVTGASGFIGSHLVHRLVSLGARVSAVGRSPGLPARLVDVADRVHWIAADLRDRHDITAAVEASRPDFVFHMAGFAAGRSADAARQPELLVQSYDINLAGTLNLLIALQNTGRHVRRIVRLGTLEEYGDGPVPYRESQREAPVSPYSSSQVASTFLCGLLHRRAGMPIVTLRPALTYGPGQDESFFIPGLIAACVADATFHMTGGSQTRDFLYITDLVDACVAAASALNAPGEILNIGSGVEHRIVDVAEAIVALAGGGRLSIGSLSDRDPGLPRLVCDPALALDVLGWRPRLTLEAGLAATIAWFRTNRAVGPEATRA